MAGPLSEALGEPQTNLPLGRLHAVRPMAHVAPNVNRIVACFAPPHPPPPQTQSQPLRDSHDGGPRICHTPASHNPGSAQEGNGLGPRAFEIPGGSARGTQANVLRRCTCKAPGAHAQRRGPGPDCTNCETAIHHRKAHMQGAGSPCTAEGAGAGLHRLRDGHPSSKGTTKSACTDTDTDQSARKRADGAGSDWDRSSP